MTATDVYTVLDEAFPGAVNSGPHGVTMGPIRLECGSGIAGRGGIWSITFPGNSDIESICGLRTRKDLRLALRELILHTYYAGRGLALLCDGLADAWNVRHGSGK